MNLAGKSQTGISAEKPRLPVAGVIELRLKLHECSDRSGIHKFRDGPIAGGVQALVSIDVKHPVGANFFEPAITRRGKVVVPFEMEHTRAERPSDRHGTIHGTRINYDDIVNLSAQRRKTIREKSLLIADD